MASPLDNLWSFYCRRGSAGFTKIIRASGEAQAMAVAARWSRKNGYRAPASVDPMVVADASILDEPEGPVVPNVPTLSEANTAIAMLKVP